MKSWVMLLGVILLLTSCSRQDLSSPQSAFSAYQAAVNANDYSAIKRVTTEDFRAQMKSEGNDLKDIGAYFKKAGLKSADCKLTYFKQDSPAKATIGCTGIYVYTNGMEDQGYSEEYFILVLDGNDWKIDEHKSKI